MLADHSGCGFYRVEAPLTALAEHRGWHVDMNTILPIDEPALDILLAQRTSNEGPTEIIRSITSHNHRPVVYEVDDALWDIHTHSRKARAFYGRPEVQQAIHDNMARATLISTTNEALAQQVIDRVPHAEVVVLPNQIPASMIATPKPRETTSGVVLGWAGSPTHGPDIDRVAYPLSRIAKHQPSTWLHTIGWNGQGYLRWPNKRRRHTPWQFSVTEYAPHLDAFDIALAPLAPNPFNEAKSDIKILEYGARGLPVIASDVGPYARARAAGAPILLASDEKQWRAHLSDLITDPAARAELGAALNRWVHGRTVEANVDLWHDALAPLAAEREAQRA